MNLSNITKRKMAAIKPTALFPGFSAPGATAASVTNSIVIPLAALPALTAAEADPINGDGREVLRAIIEQATNAILALDAASKPTKLTVSKSNPSGTGVNQITQTYSQSFSLNLAQSNLAMPAE